MNSKEEIKALVLRNLSQKRIVLFGAGKVAENFYNLYRDKLNISHCVSNIAKEWGQNKFLDQLDVRQYKREEIQKNDYIIVCGPIAFRNIEIQLLRDGLEMYTHFVESNIADAIFQEKKIALFYGTCVLRDIYLCTIQVQSFCDIYASIFTQAPKDQPAIMNRVLYYAKDICDIYVYTPKILDRDSVYELAREELPDDCKVISLSNLVVSLYWPQINAKLAEYNPDYLYSYNSRRNLNFFHTLYRREDTNIHKMLLEKKSTKDIVKALSDEDFYSEKEVRRNQKVVFKLIEIAEKGVNITILDYIKENYQNQMIYQNFIHPNKCIVWEYVRRFLNMIDIDTDEVSMLEKKSPEHIHQSGDVPVYPCVIKHMQLSWAEEKKKYEILTGDGIRFMTFEEYIEHFVEYERKVMEIMQLY